VPDWIVVPGGNLGNSSAFGKGLKELYQLGLIDRMPRLAIIQAEGANPLYRSFADGSGTLVPVHAETVATAIKIGKPVNYQKAWRTLEWTDGIVEQVSDQEIMDAKALIDATGIGCEPASACSLAGVRKLVSAGVMRAGDRVVGVLTGHVLKDPEATIDYHRGTLQGIVPSHANKVYESAATLESLRAILEDVEYSGAS
jgi:threonine synthase